MPTPVIPQPISTGPGAAWADMSCGRLNVPAPIIEPMTMAASGSSVSLRPPLCGALGASVRASVTETVIAALLLRPPARPQAARQPARGQAPPDRA